MKKNLFSKAVGTVVSTALITAALTGCAGSGNTIVSKRAITTHESDTNSVQDDIGKHNDGEADESLNKRFLAVGDFAGIAVR